MTLDVNAVTRPPRERRAKTNHSERKDAASSSVVGQTSSIDRFSNAIAVAWRKSTASILETGRLLIEAKESLKHGQWREMVELHLPFKKDVAQRLIAIARSPILSKADHDRLLPPSYQTLYELTKLPETELETKIADGTINPKTERKDVTKWRLPASTINSKAERKGVAESDTAKRTRSSRKPPRNLKTLEEFCDLFSFGIADARELLTPKERIALRAHILQAIPNLNPPQNQFIDDDDIECPPPAKPIVDDYPDLPKCLDRSRKAD
jgi:Protein of unknown function (DUF3102)